MSQNKARGKPKTPSGGGGTLFSYFKPKTPSSAATCDSPTPSTNGKQAAVTPHHASTNGKHATPSRKRKNDEGSNTPLTPCLPRAVLCEDDSNGEVGVRKVDDGWLGAFQIVYSWLSTCRISLEDQSAELQCQYRSADVFTRE